MRSQILTALAALPALALATPAFAQDEAERQPFTGLYIGVSGGFDMQPNDVGESIVSRQGGGSFQGNIPTATGAPFFTSFCNGQALNTDRNNGCLNDRDSWSYAGRIGFDVQRGPFVIGVVGEFGQSDIRDAVSGFTGGAGATAPDGGPAPTNAYVLNREIDYTGNARLRAGFAANRTLFYVTGGGLYARVKNRFNTSDGTSSFTTSNRNNDAWGWTAGGGIEQKLTRHVSFGLEYLYNSLDNNDFRVRASDAVPGSTPFTLTDAGGTDLARSDRRFEWHSVRATLAFRF